MRSGSSATGNSFSNLVGTGSNRHVVGLDAVISLFSSSCPIVVKYSSFSLGAVNEAEVLDAVESTLVIVFLMLSILSVKNLSAAFDLVDHNILLSCLESCLGLRGMVLQWFRSYLSNRCFTVQIGHCVSTDIPLGCGVLQGSILGPVLFSMYLLPLASIFFKIWCLLSSIC